MPALPVPLSTSTCRGCKLQSNTDQLSYAGTKGNKCWAGAYPGLADLWRPSRRPDLTSVLHRWGRSACFEMSKGHHLYRFSAHLETIFVCSNCLLQFSCPVECCSFLVVRLWHIRFVWHSMWQLCATFAKSGFSSMHALASASASSKRLRHPT